MTFWDDCGDALGVFGMLSRALEGLGSGSKSIVFVMDYQGVSGILSSKEVEGEASIWEA